MESLKQPISVGTLACTGKASLMVRVCTNGLMDEHMSATTFMIKNKVLASTHGLMAKSTRASGVKESKRVLVASQIPRISPALENGMKESAWLG